MIRQDVFDKAIAAHAGWKARLRTTVSSGKSDVPASTVKADNQCDFGKWLNGAELSATEKQNDTYREVKQLHATILSIFRLVFARRCTFAPGRRG